MAAYIDLIMCMGCVVLFMAFPTAVSAFSRGEPPRAAILSIFAGVIMIAYANAQRPGGYEVADLPNLFLKVISGA